MFFFLFQQHQGLFRAKLKNSTTILSPAEKKLLFVFSYYIVFTLVTLVYYSMTTRDTDKFLAAVEDYFICEGLGHDPENPCPKDYEQYRYPIMEGVVYILMGFIPTVSLIFVIHIQRSRKKISKLAIRIQSLVSKSVHSKDHPDSAMAAMGRSSPLLLAKLRIRQGQQTSESDFKSSSIFRDIPGTPSHPV